MNRTLQYVFLAVAVLTIAAAGLYSYIVSPTKVPSPLEVEVKPEVAAEKGLYRIDPARTTATFTLNEVLRGTPTVVTGVTHDVSGDVTADMKDLLAARIGTVRVNARTFVTDDEKRNNAIRRMILKTEDDANQYIEFMPKVVTGLPQQTVFGAQLPMSVTGDLKISGQVKEVTFTGSVTFASENEVSGTANAKIHYPDWNIFVPNFPFLANVDQDVVLQLDFVAAR